MMGEEGIIILIYWKVSHVFRWNITKLLLYIWHSGNFKDSCQRTTRAVLSCSDFQLLLMHSHLQKSFFEPICSDCWYCLWWHHFGWYLVLCNYWVLFLLMRVFWGKKKKNSRTVLCPWSLNRYFGQTHWGEVVSVQNTHEQASCQRFRMCMSVGVRRCPGAVKGLRRYLFLGVLLGRR